MPGKSQNTDTPPHRGDPERVVLYGQSAGGNAVASYAYAYPEDPIVTGLIASSGSVSTTNSANNSAFHDLAQVVGCANLTDTEELACMQKVDALELQKYVEGIETQAFKGSFRPIADGVTAFPNNTERLEKGLIAKVVSLVLMIMGFILTLADKLMSKAHDHRLQLQRRGCIPTV